MILTPQVTPFLNFLPAYLAPEKRIKYNFLVHRGEKVSDFSDKRLASHHTFVMVLLNNSAYMTRNVQKLDS